MLNFYIMVSVVLAFIFVILGLIVVTRNSASTINRIFLIFSILISGWLITNYIGGDPNFSHSVSLIVNRLIFLFGLSTALSLALFVKELTLSRSNPLWRLLIGVNLIDCLLCLSPLIVRDVSLQGGTYIINFGTLSPEYFGLLIFNFLLVVFVAFSAGRRQKGLIKSRIDTMLAALGVTLGGVIITNGLLPFLFNYYGLSNAGSFLTTILVAGLAYSIIRHKLFDIRAFAVRALAYSLTFAVAALLYIVPVVFLISLITHTPLSTSTLIILIPATLITAMLFQPLKSYFNKTTGKLFFRDYYEPQDVLDKLSSLLVGSVDLNHIKAQSRDIIGAALKPAAFSYILKNEDRFDNSLVSQLHKYRKDLVSFDDTDEGTSVHLRQEMDKEGVAVAIKLRTKHEDLGYMLLGFKQSGSSYSESDLRLLSIAADEIAVGLQNALRFEEIRQFNITLREKVEEATKELRHANSRLKELDHTKDEFISMASHQLRTPLTTVKGYLSMILEGDVGPVTKNEKQMIQQAFDSAERMVYLIADLLNVSRLQSGKFVIENKPTDLAKMVETEVEQLNKTAQNHHLTLTYKSPEKFPRISVDDTKIRQVVMNFLDNAIYYTPAGGSIEAAVQATDKEVIYTVTDTGLGVPKAEQHHLFSKFYRAGNARKMRPDGTGLGLFMAKKVIAAQGGAIIFKSTEGKGSTFGFSFPRAKVEIKP